MQEQIIALLHYKVENLESFQSFMLNVQLKKQDLWIITGNWPSQGSFCVKKNRKNQITNWKPKAIQKKIN